MRNLIRSLALTLAAAAILLSGGPSAFASNQALAPLFGVAPSTSPNCTINYPTGQTSFYTNGTGVPTGTLIATCAVLPSNWVGTLSLSGADASFFAISGETVVVGSAAITVARTYNITVTATP